MKHHAFTNDPAQDPDVFVDGPKRDLVQKFYGYTMVSLLLPLFAFVPATRRLLPRKLREREIPRDPDEDRYSFRFWLMRTTALIVAFAAGIGREVLWLWFVPTLMSRKTAVAGHPRRLLPSTSG
jgi:fatty acid desaturase